MTRRKESVARGCEHRRAWRRGPLLGLCVLLVWLGLAFPSGAEAQQAVLSSSSDEPAVGEAFQVRLEVSGNRVEPPEINAEGLDIDYVGASASRQMSFGPAGRSVVVKKTFAYRAVAQRTGPVEIPAVRVTADGKEVRSNSLALTVREAQDRGASGSARTPTAFIRIEAERPEIYVGELVGAKVKVYFGPKIEVLDMQREIALQGEDLVFQPSGSPKRSVENVGTTQYQVYTFETVFSAVKPGEVRAEPVTVEATVRLPPDARPQNRRSESILERFFGEDPFFDSFLDRGLTERVAMTTDPIVWKVLPLPKDGRPEDFKGAIGNFTLAVEAEPGRLQMDEPLTVRIRVAGKGNFDRIQEVGVEEGGNWKAYPASSEFTPNDSLGRSGEKRFEQVFLAQGPATQGPEISFSFFDPLRKEYVSLSAPPISVQVTGKAVATSGEVEETVADAELGSQAEDAPGSRRFLRTQAQDWAVGSQPYLLASPRFVGLQIGGGLLAGTAWVLGALWKRNRDPGYAARRRWEKEKALLSSRVAGGARGKEEFLIAAADLIAVLGRDPVDTTRLTAREALKRLRIEGESAALLEEAVNEAEKVRWSAGGSQGVAERAPVERIREILRDLAGSAHGSKG